MQCRDNRRPCRTTYLHQHIELAGGNVTACQQLCQADPGCAMFHWHRITEQCSLAPDTAWQCNVLVS